MNGLEIRYRTLGELLTELKARLGFVAQGPSANNNNPVLISFLTEGHNYLYKKLKPQPARKKTAITLEPGSFLYDWHNDLEDENIDPASVRSVWLKKSDTDRTPLVQGISETHRADTSRGDPMRYDTINGQIELWPVPSATAELLIEYIAPRPRFSQPADRPGVDDALVLLYAIANAKAHYRHPDAQAAGATFAEMLKLEMSGQHENRRYIVNAGDSGSQTVTVDGAGNHTLRIG